ncbi:hypothetical protein PSSHI_42870 [Photobacterium sp. R1]
MMQTRQIADRSGTGFLLNSWLPLCDWGPGSSDQKTRLQGGFDVIQAQANPPLLRNDDNNSLWVQ